MLVRRQPSCILVRAELSLDFKVLSRSEVRGRGMDTDVILGCWGVRPLVHEMDVAGDRDTYVYTHVQAHPFPRSRVFPQLAPGSYVMLCARGTSLF